MKISELKNAPQWLLDATTENANVEIACDCLVWRGGEWHGGEWHGGLWRGGKWRDPMISDRLLFHASFCGIVFNDDAQAVAYRVTHANGVGRYAGNFIQREGEFRESDYAPAGSGTCRKGIHVCSAGFAAMYFTPKPDDELWEVRFGRDDLLDCDGQKARIRGGVFRRIPFPWATRTKDKSQ